MYVTIYRHWWVGTALRHTQCYFLGLTLTVCDGPLMTQLVTIVTMIWTWCLEDGSYLHNMWLLEVRNCWPRVRPPEMCKILSWIQLLCMNQRHLLSVWSRCVRHSVACAPVTDRAAVPQISVVIVRHFHRLGGPQGKLSDMQCLSYRQVT